MTLPAILWARYALRQPGEYGAGYYPVSFRGRKIGKPVRPSRGGLCVTVTGFLEGTIPELCVLAPDHAAQPGIRLLDRETGEVVGFSGERWILPPEDLGLLLRMEPGRYEILSKGA